jgi:hypothetical protein
LGAGEQQKCAAQPDNPWPHIHPAGSFSESTTNEAAFTPSNLWKANKTSRLKSEQGQRSKVWDVLFSGGWTCLTQAHGVIWIP